MHSNFEYRFLLIYLTSFSFTIEALIDKNMIFFAGTCLPIHMVYYIGSQNPDSGSVFTLDILSIKPEIINPSVFIPPSSCQHVTSYKEKRVSSNIFIKLYPEAVPDQVC